MKGVEYYRSEAFSIHEIKTCMNDLHAYKDHLHQELSIGYIDKGESILNISGVDYNIKAGEAVIIYPYVSHKCQPIDSNNWEFTMIYIESKFYEGVILNLDNTNSIGIKKFGDYEFNQIKKLSAVLKSNISGFDKEIELVNTLIQLFTTCDINIQLQTSKKIEPIKTFIEEHFLEVMTLKDLEDKFGVNKFALIRSFKNEFNTTPNAYQLQLKANYAKQLLISSDNITDIALQSGFYDQAHFTKEFKKAYGITPLQYQRALKG